MLGFSPCYSNFPKNVLFDAFRNSLSRSAVLRASRPSDPSPEHEFWLIAASVRNTGCFPRAIRRGEGTLRAVFQAAEPLRPAQRGTSRLSPCFPTPVAHSSQFHRDEWATCQHISIVPYRYSPRTATPRQSTSKGARRVSPQ